MDGASTKLPIAANYFVLEGPNGAGKTTMQPLLCQYLAARRGIVRAYHDPNPNMLLGELIYRIRNDRLPLIADSRELLWAASSIEAQQGSLPQAEQQGAVIVADRSPFTSYVELWSFTVERFLELHRPYRFPHLTFHFRIDPELCHERLAGRGDRTDSEEWLRQTLAKRSQRYAEIYDAVRRRGVTIVDIEVTREKRPEDLAEEVGDIIIGALATAR